MSTSSLPSVIKIHLEVLKKKDKKEEIWLGPMKKPQHQQKCQKGKVTTQTTQQKSSIEQ